MTDNVVAACNPTAALDVLDIVEDSRDSCGVSKSAPSLGGDGNVKERSESSTSNSIFGMVDCSRSLI